MPSNSPSRVWYLRLLIPIIAVIWVPWYNGDEPRLLGFPFFYWYQLAWVPGSALIIGLVYKITKG
jgi:hypothetical protein